MLFGFSFLYIHISQQQLFTRTEWNTKTNHKWSITSTSNQSRIIVISLLFFSSFSHVLLIELHTIIAFVQFFYHETSMKIGLSKKIYICSSRERWNWLQMHTVIYVTFPSTMEKNNKNCGIKAYHVKKVRTMLTSASPFIFKDNHQVNSAVDNYMNCVRIGRKREV